MRKQIIVSDFTGRQIGDGELVKVTMQFQDGRKGVWVSDAHIDDPIVKELAVGKHERTRGRKPKLALAQVA